ncbi:MAG TPA: sterol desaturase family protein [Pyrinomonadaceae bacterium]|nr:sterol desaturase family protein [Pyrinomonadaceae bacterium]
MKDANWRKFTPLFIYTAVALCLGFVAAGHGLSKSRILMLLVSGVFSWSLIEYGLHRFIFHYDAHSRLGRKLLYQVHLSHHENPTATNRIFASLFLSLPLAVAYWLVAWIITASWAASSYLFIGMSAGYFVYEWLHFQCHHGQSHLRVLRYLRKYHLLHHHKTPELRFGVTSPLFDLVFGTFRRAERTRARSDY